MIIISIDEKKTEKVGIVCEKACFSYLMITKKCSILRLKF